MRRELLAIVLVLVLGGLFGWQWRESRPVPDWEVHRPGVIIFMPSGGVHTVRRGHWEYEIGSAEGDGFNALQVGVLRRRPLTTFARLREWLGADRTDDMFVLVAD